MDSDPDSIAEPTSDNPSENESSVPVNTRFIDYQDYKMTGRDYLDRKSSSRTPKMYKQHEFREDSIDDRKKGVALNQPMIDRQKR